MQNPIQLTPTRVTLRCLREDLADGWRDVADRRLAQGSAESLTKLVHELDHPVIRKAVGDYPLGQEGRVERESISGLADPPFWKLKTDRWRGAIYVDPETNQPWLVAAGLRRGGEATDFYANFLTQVGRLGAGHFLPTEEDGELLRREVEDRTSASDRDERMERLKRLEGAASVAFLQAVAEGLQQLGEPVSFDLMLDQAPGETSSQRFGFVEVLVVLDDDASPDGVVSVMADVTLTDWERVKLIEWMVSVMAAALERNEGKWGLTTTSPGGGLVQTLSVDFATRADLVAACTQYGHVTQPGEFLPGGHVHTVPKSPLVDSMVEGHAIQGVCGRWFVPRQDHHHLPRCPECAGIQDVLNITAS